MNCSTPVMRVSILVSQDADLQIVADLTALNIGAAPPIWVRIESNGGRRVKKIIERH